MQLNDIKELSGSNFLLKALEAKRKGSENEYLNLVQLIKSNAEKSVMDIPCVSQWLLTFIRHISLLRHDCRSLVEQVLKLRWVSHDDEFCEIFHRFVVHLVSAHPAYVFEVIERITKYFIHSKRALRSQLTFPASKLEDGVKEKAKRRLHLLLKEVIVLVPTSTTHLCKRLTSFLPTKDKSLSEHVGYTEHLLLVARYIPMLRDQLLTALMNRILQLDSEIQIEVDELKEMVQEDAPGEVFSMETDEPSDEEDISDTESVTEIKNASPRAIEVMIQKLDAMLNLMLEYVKTFDFSQQEGYGLFYHMVHIFNASIIRTFKSRHAQFVMFYLCSLQSRFADAFLGVLFDQLASADAPQVTRIASVAYLSSFTARAKFLDDNDVRKVTSLLLNWLGSYMENTPSGDIRLDPTRHALFYATTQATLYLFCFRWRSFRTQSGEWDPCVVPLRHVLHSSFRPLKGCNSQLVLQFAQLSQQLGFMYCYSIIESDNRLLIPSSSNGEKAEVEPFFPFDPYQLVSSSHFFKDIYIAWDEANILPHVSIESPQKSEQSENISESLPSPLMSMMNRSPALAALPRILKKTNNTLACSGDSFPEGDLDLGSPMVGLSLSPMATQGWS